GGRAGLRIHVPLALPIGADEGSDNLVDEIAAALPHQALFFGKAAPRGDVEHDGGPIVTPPCGWSRILPCARARAGCFRSSWRRRAARSLRRECRKRGRR